MSDKLPPKLSPREEEVINLAAQGLTDNGIANRLEISATTVNSYWVRIRSKLGSLSRTELVRDYLMAGADRALRAVQEENERLHQELRTLSSNGKPSAEPSAAWAEILQRSSDTVLLVGVDGAVTHASRSATALFGYEIEELIGLPVEDLVPGDLRTVHHIHRTDYVSNPTSRKMGGHIATPALRKDGSMFPVSVVLTPVDSEVGVSISCYLRDISSELESARIQLASVAADEEDQDEG